MPSETTTYRDPDTAVPVRQLTDYRGHSHHLYFTNPGWYAGGRKLAFGSDRDNRSNLYGVDLETGEIERLSDLPHDADAVRACVSRAGDYAYINDRACLYRVDLARRQTEPIWRIPDGFETSMCNVTADGRHVCVGAFEDLSDRFDIDLLHGYVGFRELFEARPLSRIYRVDPTNGVADVVHEDHHWLGHVNTSPTRASLLTFCHEGPWDRVGQRIWGLDLASGRVWPIRRQAPGEAIGHEYWLADGEHVGYHGWTASGPIYGWCRFDDTGHVEAPFPHASQHFHSNDRTLIVGDGEAGRCPHVLLWRYDGERFDGPRKLCVHRSSRHHQAAHVHPCFSPDGTKIVFTSDRTGYCNVYEAEVPPFEDLPRYEPAIR